MVCDAPLSVQGHESCFLCNLVKVDEIATELPLDACWKINGDRHH